KTDRILVFEDTDGDGIADKRSIFYEGHTFSTDLLFGPDGHLYVSTRWFIGRFKDAAKKTKAEGEPERIVICDTEGDYPHNGVGGLAIDPADPGWLAFGFGENLGVEYTFIGSDGTRLSGGAEGGSTDRCRTDVSSLSRQSTGHWTAFGMAFDLSGNLYSTDNDPNATPPNRLLHVVPGADFGYEYRYGRSGRHPLVCWYGENPGTLGMIGALGEAACGLIPYGAGKLLSASWTDNRVDLHTLQPSGASFIAGREPFLSGPDDFRPVHFSYSADGKYLYFTDWVKLSYPVHGHGRIWRVELKQPVSLEPLPRSKPIVVSPEGALALLGSDDPYLRTQAIRKLTENPESLSSEGWKEIENSTARAHYAVAMKRVDIGRGLEGTFTSSIASLLKDSDPAVRFVGIKWIADENLASLRPNLEQMLDRSDLGRGDLKAIVAALAKISTSSKKEFSPDDTLFKLALDPSKPTNLRAVALASVDVDHKPLTVKVLASLIRSEPLEIRREAVRSLTFHSSEERGTLLAVVALDTSIESELRADAIAGLASIAVPFEKVLSKLRDDANPAVAAEALRSMKSSGLMKQDTPERPKPEDLSGWKSLLRQAEGEPDVAVGRRLFFHAKLGGCYKCHAMHGRGKAIGPDLTTIHKQSGITEDWLLEHIANPNAEMAPYYRPQVLLTFDGDVYTGLVIGQEGQKQAYVGSDGEVFFVDKNEVEERRELATSIMPTGLLDPMSGSEIRDLIAYLLDSPDDQLSQ
ncbi:MAG: PVC-type heme-binding CxxCH protein, partial [Planctomycetota bacterium]